MLKFDLCRKYIYKSSYKIVVICCFTIFLNCNYLQKCP
nr:MAG TPA: hypothetical protein [Caudoviricetes sp.]